MNRRELVVGAALGGALCLGNVKNGAVAATRESSLDDLKVAQLRDPLGLDDQRPTLSWRLVGSRRGLAQSAYRIRVATDPQALRAGGSDLWDSGRVASGQSVGVTYGGQPLGSRQQAWWTVTVWDERGAVVNGPIAFWEAPLLVSSDWSATWIAVEGEQDRADRLVGMPQVVAPTPPQGAGRKFRLAFACPVGGQAVVTLFASGQARDVRLDGEPLILPSHPADAFGGPPARRASVAIAPGHHSLDLEVEAATGFIPEPTVAVGAQIRIRRPDGTDQYVTEGWTTWLDGATGWSACTPRAPAVHPPWPPSAALLLRRRFNTPRPVRARLYVAALGAYEMRLNGKRVGEDILQSETSDVRKTVFYRTYDVTGLVQSGQNVLGAIVGDGWYASYAAPSGRYAFGPAPRRLIAQLEIVDDHGEMTVIATDTDWRLAPSPITSSELYDGEAYDARLELPGWDAPGFDDASWAPCHVADPPPGHLKAQVGPAIRIAQTLPPRAIHPRGPGVVVVDFGQNFAGLARLKVTGPRGARVTLRFSEILGPDGQIDQRNLRAAKATDSYVLKGDQAGETFLPRFTYHGFRYVEMSGLPESWSVEGVVLGSDLAETGTLQVKQPLIQKLWLNTLWSQRSNFFAVPTDCPQRDERLGWTGDAQVFWDTAAFNMDVGPFTRRFLGDLRDAQTAKGAFPIWAPIVAPPPGGSPGWSDAGVMLPWICWRRYGDLAMAREHFPAMAAYVDGVVADNPDLIWRNVQGADFGDWLSLDAKTPAEETTPKALTATAMLKRSLDQVADLAQALGMEQAAASYRARAQATAQAFQAAFVTADGRVGNGSQTGYILAIALDLLAPAQFKAAGAHLAGDIRRRGTLLSTGFLGTPLSLDALARIGETRLIYDLLLRTEFPSWGYMVARGATTVWERWNGDTGDVAMNSYNHYALGAIVGFLYRRIAGIEEIEPGFSAFRVAPLLDARLPSASARYESVRGRIETAWTLNTQGRFSLELIVPPNSRAQVRLPALQQDLGYAGAEGLRVSVAPDGVRVVEALSGRYRFASRAPVLGI